MDNYYEIIITDLKGLVVYSYRTENEGRRFGYKIYKDKEETILLCESKGYLSYIKAFTSMKEKLEELKAKV